MKVGSKQIILNKSHILIVILFYLSSSLEQNIKTLLLLTENLLIN